MEKHEYILHKLNEVQKASNKKGTSIRGYRRIAKFMIILNHYIEKESCKTCSDIQDELHSKIAPIYSSPTSNWHWSNFAAIFNIYHDNASHLIKGHNFYRKKRYIYWVSLALIPVDIIMIILFFMSYAPPVFLVSLLFYYTASYIESKYIKIFNRKCFE